MASPVLLDPPPAQDHSPETGDIGMRTICEAAAYIRRTHPNEPG